MATKAKIGILGASGYTGADAVRLLARHPNVEIAAVTALSAATPISCSISGACRWVPTE